MFIIFCANCVCAGKECFLCQDWWLVFGHSDVYFFFFLTVSLVIGGWKTCAEPSNTIVSELAEN